MEVSDNTTDIVLDPTKHNIKRCAESFIITFDAIGLGHEENLQNAFRKFRRERQKEYKCSIDSKGSDRLLRTDRERMWILRMKFLNRAKTYFGVPYSRKYWSAEDPEYNAPLFLDCCALVRRVLRDLKAEFGFRIGPWNQAYQYDTLPLTIASLDDVKPGDLVFISATYNNPKAKKQRHNLTHVEIMTGDGPKTIGARWQKGKVQVFENYMFEAKSYHTPTYTFKSIDTWLMGKCVSHCSEHKWLTRRERRQKRVQQLKREESDCNVFEDTRSIFSRVDSDEDVGNCCAGDTDEELFLSADDPVTLQRQDADECSGQLENTCDSEAAGWFEYEEVDCEDDDDLAGTGNAELEFEVELKLESSSSDSDIESENELHFLKELASESALFKRASFYSEESIISASSSSHSEASSYNKPAATYSSNGYLLAPSIGKLTNEVCTSDSDVAIARIASGVGNLSLDVATKTNQGEKNSKLDYYDVINHNVSFVIDKMAEHTSSSGHGTLTNNSMASDGVVQSINQTNNSMASDGVVQSINHINSSAVNSDNCLCDDANCCGHDYNIQLLDLLGQQGTVWGRSEASDTAINENRNSILETTGEGARSSAVQEGIGVRSCCLPLIKSTHVVLHPTERVHRGAYYRAAGARRPKRDEAVTARPDTGATSTMPSETSNRAAAPLSEDGSPSQPEKAAVDSGDAQQAAPALRKLPRASRNGVVQLANNQVPAYYIGGGNGNTLVDGPLSRLGWRRTMDKNDDFRLKWTECKGHINYNAFKEGEQMVNHIPNGSAMTNKLGLFSSLKEYDRLLTTTRKRYMGILMKDFYPETYNLDDKQDKEAFIDIYKEGEIWICKPTGMNQGKGIYLVRTLEEIRKLVSSREEKQTQNATKRLMGRIIQRYLPTPLLLEGKKFDIRTYMAITSTVPFFVFYHKGYCRLSCQNYCKDSDDMKIHLTNQYIQKRDPQYMEVKEETIWSMERLNDYINQQVAPKRGLAPDWVTTVFVKQTQKIMLHLFKSVRNKLGQKIGYFELYGLDFMIDHDMKIYLIEVNVNPSLATNCEMLRGVIPLVVEETLAISIESFEKARKNLPLQPLKSVKNFICVYSETTARERNSRAGSPERRASQVSPSSVTRYRGSSPSKEAIREEMRKPPVLSPFSRPLSLPRIVTNAAQKPSVSTNARRPLATKLFEIDSSNNAVESQTTPISCTSAVTNSGKHMNIFNRSAIPVRLKLTISDEVPNEKTKLDSSRGN